MRSSQLPSTTQCCAKTTAYPPHTLENVDDDVIHAIVVEVKVPAPRPTAILLSFGDGKTWRAGRSGAVASLVVALPRVTRRVTGRPAGCVHGATTAALYGRCVA
jgi:hypothetical protein